ncbi:hypothetical protein N7582_003996 [Saccharomyces uvarum]|uniref:Nicotinamide-nucleotide adenylyltransferase n=1 Tax=Saccharomyces uvarum TaxID=230603 RepID=A0AA35NKH3_SACUV|nr:hypothetical protein N7582_003996 [Saccharomyces uvarum]CAI4047137.1 hypothetical protein SUVC_12G3620 [Saccharomyces uvarum]
MDPTRAPDFKPPSPDEELNPPPDPESKIPKSIPIIPYVLADANTSIDAPFHIKRKKNYSKNHHHNHRDSKDKKHQHIPLNQDDFQPLSAEASSEDDDADLRTKQRSNSDSNTESETRGVQKYQIADLEEVPHGIVRQARNLEDYEFPSHRLSKKLLDPNKLPLVIVACGSFSPITYLHLRMFEMALDAISEQTRFEVIGGYYSPVSDNYQKQGLAPSYRRVRMCELACERTSSWLMVDAWESLQPTYTRTAKVLDHFNHEINIKRGGVATVTGEKIGVKIMLLAGGDLIESMGEPNVWADADLHHILGNYGCLIVERTGSDVRSFLLSHDIMYEHRRNILIIKQLIYNDISSTKVRLFIRRGMSVQYLLPNSVIRYIQEHRLYVDQTEPVKQVLGNKE